MKKIIVAILIAIVLLVIITNVVVEILLPMVGLACVGLSLWAVIYYVKKHHLSKEGDASK